MAVDSSEELRILKKKREPAEEIDKAIKRRMRELREALAAKQQMRICELSRALADEVDHVFSHPELWPPERVETIGRLLEEAVSATMGTQYEDDCTARPKEFEDRLKSLLAAREVVSKIQETQRPV